MCIEVGLGTQKEFVQRTAKAVKTIRAITQQIHQTMVKKKC
jgi:hypothetical protein